MLGSLFAMGLFGILLFIILIVFTVLIVAFVVKYIIVSVIQVRAGYNEAKAKAEHGEGSIGALIAEGEHAAARGDVGKLLDTSVDRKDAMKIMKWFNDTVTSGDYYCVRNTEADTKGKDYAIVMTNRSGYDFRVFKCLARPKARGISKGVAICKTTDWKQGAEGELWFRCKDPHVDKLSIEVKDISYEIGIGAEEDAKRRQEQRTEDLIQMAGSARAGGRMVNDAVEYPYACPDCGGYYDGILCPYCGYSSEEAEIYRGLHDPFGWDDEDV